MSGTFSRYYTDYASTGVGKTVVYVYDELNRMTSASTTAASSTPYLRTYDYDDLGSMTYASDLGNYTYGETSYANPNAVTQIANGLATTTYAYDNSGNLLTASANNYTWDYRNRMTRSGGTATTTYGYDSGIQRMWKADGTATSTYPSRYFNKERSGSQATTTKYVYVGDQLIATIEGNGTATSTKYIHTDHLGGTSATTDSDSYTLEAVDFYPYGTERISQTFSGDAQTKRYIGEYADSETSLSYLNARYADLARGQFTSQDPVFLALGDQNQVQGITQQNQRQFLADPMQQNAYAYGRGNPITQKDPAGKAILLPIMAALAVYGYAQTYVDYVNFQTVTTYPEVHRIEQIDSAGGKLLQDIWFGGIGRLGSDVQQVGLDAAGFATDVLDMYCGSHTCRNFDPGDKTPQQIVNTVITGTANMQSPVPQQYSSGSGSSNIGTKNPSSQIQRSQTGGSSTWYSSQIASIQEKINSIQAQISALVQQINSSRDN